jgi:protein subunit release factor B
MALNAKLFCITTTIMSQNTNYSNEKRQQQQQQGSSQWAEVIGQVLDKITGKNMSMTYNFDNLVIDIPRAEGPGGQSIGSAKWTINGRLIITTEAHKIGNDGNGS